MIRHYGTECLRCEIKLQSSLNGVPPEADNGCGAMAALDLISGVRLSYDGDSGRVKMSCFGRLLFMPTRGSDGLDWK